MRSGRIDSKGYRPNVAIVLINRNRELFWGKRIGQDFWQFPQGGVNSNESLRQAVYRELWEEVGLKPYHVRELNRTKEWLYYDVPGQFIRNPNEEFVGQKQIWFLLEMRFPDDRINLTKSAHPEFDDWRWGDFSPIGQVVEFKREVYYKALSQLFPELPDLAGFTTSP